MHKTRSFLNKNVHHYDGGELVSETMLESVSLWMMRSSRCFFLTDDIVLIASSPVTLHGFLKTPILLKRVWPYFLHRKDQIEWGVYFPSHDMDLIRLRRELDNLYIYRYICILEIMWMEKWLGSDLNEKCGLCCLQEIVDSF